MVVIAGVVTCCPRLGCGVLCGGCWRGMLSWGQEQGVSVQAGTVRSSVQNRVESVGTVLRLVDRVRLHKLRKTIGIVCFQARVNWKL